MRYWSNLLHACMHGDGIDFTLLMFPLGPKVEGQQVSCLELLRDLEIGIFF